MQMRFFKWGKPRTIKELADQNKINERFKFNLDRDKNIIYIIDDNEFAYQEMLENNGFMFKKKNDINSISEVINFSIILCDIGNVGKNLSNELQGAHVIKEIKEKYPYKYVIAYTGQSFDIRFNDYINYADYKAKKDINGDEWITILTQAIKKVNDPCRLWLTTRDRLIKEEIDLFTICLLEHEYVTSILRGKELKAIENTSPFKELKPVFQDIIAGLITNSILGS